MRICLIRVNDKNDEQSLKNKYFDNDILEDCSLSDHVNKT